MKIKRKATWLSGLVLLVSAVFLLFYSAKRLSEQEYSSFPSPDGRYRVVVFREVTFQLVMPGQSGDSPGTVRLYDNHGNRLQEAKVEMVQLVDRVDWEPHKVTVKFVADWDLPSE